MIFEVEIVETLVRIIKVESDSESDAIIKVKDEYRHELHVLSASDFLDVEFNIFDMYPSST